MTTKGSSIARGDADSMQTLMRHWAHFQRLGLDWVVSDISLVSR